MPDRCRLPGPAKLHVHPRGLRDLASYIGLYLIAVYWIRDLVRQSRKTGVTTIVATVLHNR